MTSLDCQLIALIDPSFRCDKTRARPTSFVALNPRFSHHSQSCSLNTWWTYHHSHALHTAPTVTTAFLQISRKNAWKYLAVTTAAVLHVEAQKNHYANNVTQWLLRMISICNHTVRYVSIRQNQNHCNLLRVHVPRKHIVHANSTHVYNVHVRSSDAFGV